MLGRIGHDADRVRARRQRDQPSPVSDPEQMVGGAPAFRRTALATPHRIVWPFVEQQASIRAKPRRVHIVAVVAGQLQPPSNQPRTTGHIEQPAGVQRAGATRVAAAHRVQRAIAAQVETGNGDAGAEVDAPAQRLGTEEILEYAAIELVAGRRQFPACTDLGHLVEVAALFGHEEAQAELADLRLIQVVPQAKRLGKVVGANLHGRLADLVRCFG